MREPIGVIHGRFQILHHGHMEYLLLGMSRCRHLVIGITNFEPATSHPDDPAAPHRTHPADNPFTYYERYCMVRDSLLEEGLDPSRFDIVPFPIEEPWKITNYTPADALYFVSIYDDWGRKKHQTLQALGLRTEILYERPSEEKKICSTHIRSLIREGADWRQLVPPAVYKYIREHSLEERIRQT